MKNSLSPYPINVRVNGARQVFRDGKYLGYVDKVKNWGRDYLARPEIEGNNAFFATQTEAVNHILSTTP